MAKQKGKRGEQDFAQLVRDTLGQVTRKEAFGPGQKWVDPANEIRALPHDQGADFLAVSGLAIEVKRQEVLLVDKWWQQACVQADSLGLVPVLAYRQNRKKWSVCLPAYLLMLHLDGYITLDERLFQKWLLSWVNDKA